MRRERRTNNCITQIPSYKPGPSTADKANHQRSKKKNKNQREKRRRRSLGYNNCTLSSPQCPPWSKQANKGHSRGQSGINQGANGKQYQGRNYPRVGGYSQTTAHEKIARKATKKQKKKGMDKHQSPPRFPPTRKRCQGKAPQEILSIPHRCRHNGHPRGKVQKNSRNRRAKGAFRHCEKALRGTVKGPSCSPGNKSDRQPVERKSENHEAQHTTPSRTSCPDPPAHVPEM